MEELFIKGGPVMWALLCCSIVGMYIVLSKFYFIYTNRFNSDFFLKRLSYLYRQQNEENLIKSLKSKDKLHFKASLFALNLPSYDDKLLRTESIKSYCLSIIGEFNKDMSILSGLITITPLFPTNPN